MFLYRVPRRALLEHRAAGGDTPASGGAGARAYLAIARLYIAIIARCGHRQYLRGRRGPAEGKRFRGRRHHPARMRPGPSAVARGILQIASSRPRRPRSRLRRSAIARCVQVPHQSAADNDMLEFAALAVGEPVEFQKECRLPSEVSEALSWVTARTAAQVNADREAIVRQIEFEAGDLVSSGAAARWMLSASPEVRSVAKGVNGPLLERLAHRAGFEDLACIEFFRWGAPAAGPLPPSGSGAPTARDKAMPVVDLLRSAEKVNAAMIASLREDKHASELLRVTAQDVAAGRMRDLSKVGDLDLNSVILSPRFGVEQVKSDGSVRVRPIDDLSRSKLNGCTSVAEKFRPEGVDLLFETSKRLALETDEPIAFFKADVDSAFRRVPASPLHSALLYIVFLFQGVAHVARHCAMPFGAIASVHAWERVGALISRIARVVLHVPLLRFVDDLFAAERRGSAVHALHCVARLVRCMLGPEAIAPAKMGWGLQLQVLGLNVSADRQGFSCEPSADKVVKWRSRIYSALNSNSLRPGDASKLAGALRWASTNMFHRLGRATIVPLYRQAKQSRANVSAPLRDALRWWDEVLALELHEKRQWVCPSGSPVQLFVDARSTPPRVAAVLMHDEQIYFADWEPPRSLMSCFRQRADGMIMSLELLAIAFGLCTFDPLLRRRKVRVWSDNVGAETVTSKGSSKEWDYSCLVNCLWLKAAQLQIALRVDRVPSKLNIADLPSREEYSLLALLGAVRVKPVLDGPFWDPTSWSALSAVTARLQ